MHDLDNRDAPLGFPVASQELEHFGIKFSIGGAHISRTIMLDELGTLLANVGPSAVNDYREAIVDINILGKTTKSTRQKSLRHLRELYSLDESTPIFGLLRKLQTIDARSLPLLAFEVAWARDPLLRATTNYILALSPGESVETTRLAESVEAAFESQYSELNRHKVARNAASSWTQAGYLSGRTKKIRQQVKPSVTALTMALFLGSTCGFHGLAVFANPWCRLLDLSASRAKALALEAHRAGLINLRVVGEVVELSFPLLFEFQAKPS
jgi:hypothetical protein